MSNKPARENKRQHAAFLAYCDMDEPSVQKLGQTWGKHRVLRKFKKPALKTLELWCKKYQWVVRAEEIHKAAKEEAVRKEIEKLAMSKKEILSITRAVMLRYADQLKENQQGKITTLDFEKAWKIQKVEMGEPTEIGKHKVEIEDEYEGVSDEQLLSKFERMVGIYKKKLKDGKRKKA